MGLDLWDLNILLDPIIFYRADKTIKPFWHLIGFQFSKYIFMFQAVQLIFEFLSHGNWHSPAGSGTLFEMNFYWLYFKPAKTCEYIFIFS